MASRSLQIRNYDHNKDSSLPLLSSRRPVVPTSPVSTDQRLVSASVNLLHQLPTGSVMAFQALSSSFTNQGECHPSNWWQSLVLVIFLTVSCIFFSITDSFVSEGTLYYGVASPSRLILLNLSHKQRKRFTALHRDELKDRRLRWNDYLHAAITAVVFLAFAFGDTGIQNCFFPHADFDAKQWLKNMPLGVALVSSFLLTVFQTKRNNIDFLSRTSAHPSVTPDSSRREYDEEAAMRSNQALEIAMPGNDYLRFRIQPVQATTWGNQTTWARDDLVIVHKRRDDMVIFRNRSESDLLAPRANMDIVEENN